jgi:hypothetical protein
MAGRAWQVLIRLRAQYIKEIQKFLARDKIYLWNFFLAMNSHVGW